jgi:hypothetical protein
MILLCPFFGVSFLAGGAGKLLPAVSGGMVFVPGTANREVPTLWL